MAFSLSVVRDGIPDFAHIDGTCVSSAQCIWQPCRIAAYAESAGKIIASSKRDYSKNRKFRWRFIIPQHAVEYLIKSSIAASGKDVVVSATHQFCRHTYGIVFRL